MIACLHLIYSWPVLVRQTLGGREAALGTKAGGWWACNFHKGIKARWRGNDDNGSCGLPVPLPQYESLGCHALDKSGIRSSVQTNQSLYFSTYFLDSVCLMTCVVMFPWCEGILEFWLITLKSHYHTTSLFTRSMTNAHGGGWKGNHLLCDIYQSVFIWISSVLVLNSFWFPTKLSKRHAFWVEKISSRHFSTGVRIYCNLKGPVIFL